MPFVPEINDGDVVAEVALLCAAYERALVTNDFAQMTLDLSTEWTAFHREGAPDLYPEPLRAEIDEVVLGIYHDVNNGVYKCGFATTQEAYEKAYAALFARLDELSARLEEQRYLVGDTITEADVRLFTTLVRFDAVYVGHFKCNIRRIADYPRLSAYLADLLGIPGVRETVHLDHIKNHYYGSHKTINPTGIVPVGPELAWA